MEFQAGDRIYIDELGLGTVLDLSPAYLDSDMVQVKLDHTPRQGRHSWLNPTFVNRSELTPAPPISLHLLEGETGEEYCGCLCHSNVYITHVTACCDVCRYCFRRIKAAFRSQHIECCGGAAAHQTWICVGSASL